MAGTIEGGRLAAETNKKRYGEGFYRGIGKLGGQKSRNGGFAAEIVGKDGLTGVERAIVAGSKGGKAKKRYNRERIAA